ncbi:MAG: hypothetical protein J6Z26_04355 [Bacteroidales bacterium]|nr:hypothetical protein [Bacteroidales bacterium]MBP5759086.1 hypothetical protein [Bacteroidales bacterium]
MAYINSYCKIDDSQVLLDGQCLIPNDEGDASAWAGSIYRQLGIQYPKFFKMDTMCKFGFLASELLMRQLGTTPEEPKKDWAVLCLNSCSSLDTDRRYQTTIQEADNYFPSPSVFVYTLANIVTGEIAIRHKIQGESSTFIFQNLDSEMLHRLGSNALAPDNASNLLCGWIDFEFGHCDVLMFAVSEQKKTDTAMEWTTENIKKCFMKQSWRNFYI